MPRNPVVNRKNLSAPGAQLRQRSLEVSDDAHAAVRKVAAELHVSQGSLIDTALRVFARLPLRDIAAALEQAGHLDKLGAEYVQARIRDLEATDDDPATENPGKARDRDV